MKTARPNSLLVRMIVFLTLLSFAPAYSAAVAADSNLSKKDLKVLVKNAKTPTEHLRVAAYYRQEAQQFNASSKQHSELATTYAKNPPFPALEAKHGFAFGQGVSHCRHWAQLDAEQAEKATKLAGMHEDMARKAELEAADSHQLAPVARATTTFSSMGK